MMSRFLPLLLLFVWSIPSLSQTPCTSTNVVQYKIPRKLNDKKQSVIAIPSDRWTPVNTDHRGFSYLSRRVLARKRNDNEVIYRVEVTNRSKFTVQVSINWKDTPGNDWYIRPGGTANYVSNSVHDRDPQTIETITYRKSGTRISTTALYYRINYVEVKFTNAESVKYGKQYSGKLSCSETPNSIANKILKEKAAKEKSDAERKLSYMSENSVSDLSDKIQAYKDLAKSYPGGSYSGQISSLENKLKAKKKSQEDRGKADKLKDFIRNTPENNAENIDKKIDAYKKLEKLENKSYDGRIAGLKSKKESLTKDKSNSYTNSIKTTKNYNSSNTSYSKNKNSTGNTSSATSSYTNRSTQKKNGDDIDALNVSDAKKRQLRAYRKKVQSRNNRELKDYTNRQWKPIQTKMQMHQQNRQRINQMMNQVERASNGDQLAAGAQQVGLFIGSALGGDAAAGGDALARGLVNIFSAISAKNKQKKALEARKAAIKKKLEEEMRKKERERQRYLDGLRRNRRLALSGLTTGKYPNYLTDESSESMYFFAYYSKEDILTTDYPKVAITDIIELDRYKDGTWPFETDFKKKVTNYSTGKVTLVGGYEDFDALSKIYNKVVKGLSNGGAKITFIKTKKEVSDENEVTANDGKDFWGKKVNGDKDNSNSKSKTKIAKEDFWGKKIDVKKKNQKTKTAVKSEKKDFWGKSVKLKKKKDTIKKKPIKKKEQDFWGKQIKTKKKKVKT